MKIKTSKGGSIDAKNIMQIETDYDPKLGVRVMTVTTFSARKHIIPRFYWDIVYGQFNQINQGGGPMAGKGAQ